MVRGKKTKSFKPRSRKIMDKTVRSASVKAITYYNNNKNLSGELGSIFSSEMLRYFTVILLHYVVDVKSFNLLILLSYGLLAPLLCAYI